jgi:hypothetical protein
VLFSPDGRYVAIFAAGWVRSGNVGYFNGSSLSFFDAKTGELRRRWQTNECRFQCAEFSTDGNYFVVGGASSGASRAPIPEEMKLPIQARLGLLLFDAHTGEAIRAFEPPVRNQHDFYGVQTVAISANRHLVAAVQTDSSIAVYELATGALCRVFRGHENQVPQLAFTADGRRLVSASWDTTALVWDTSYTKLAKPAIDSSDKLWADLAKPEWQLAGPALAALAVKPDEFLSLIKERFPVATNADFDRDAIAKWVEQLDDQVFAVRERAAAALARLGREALPVLRDHLAKATVPERKSRLRKTIDQVAGSPIPSGHLRERRVLALLEQIDSSASRRELERLAGSHAEASLTQEAKSALERRVK